jgi:hypothetical protein
MKKFIFLFGFSLFCCFASAQNFGGGIMGGMSLSQLDGDTYSGYSKLGVTAGVTVNKEFFDKFVMAMELKFIQKGSRASYNINSQSGEYYRVRLNYIQLPLVAQYNFWNNFWGEAGLSYGYLINSKEENDYGELPGSVSFKKSELAALIGIAYDIPTTTLRVNARFAYSILPVRQSKGQQSSNINYFDSTSNGQYNNDLEFGLTWFLNKGIK